MSSKNLCDALCEKAEDKSKYLDLTLLLIRLSVAATFIVHGWMKIENIDQTVGFFSMLGFGAILTYIVAYGEFIGGILLAAGMATRAVGLFFTVVMFVAIYTVHLKNGFNSMNGGYEFQLLLIVCSLGLAMVGAGKYSLHQKVCKLWNK